jgi:hypothetical protein
MMKQKEKIGVVVLTVFFLVMGIILFFTAARPEGASRSIENNVIIEQRFKNRN